VIVRDSDFSRGKAHQSTIITFSGDIVEDDWQGGVSDGAPKYRYGPGFKADSADMKKLRITVKY
jgi:hypothetical protein